MNKELSKLGQIQDNLTQIKEKLEDHEKRIRIIEENVEKLVEKTRSSWY